MSCTIFYFGITPYSRQQRLDHRGELGQSHHHLKKGRTQVQYHRPRHRRLYHQYGHMALQHFPLQF